MRNYYIQCENIESYRDCINLLNYYNFNLVNVKKFSTNQTNIFRVDIDEMQACFINPVLPTKDITFTHLYDLEDEILSNKATV